MRGAKLQGRFNIDYEAKSMYEGIAEDLGEPVGQEVDWFRWQDYWLEENYGEVVDDVYDTSSSIQAKGRRWMLPFKMPTVMAQLIRSSNVMNERGFYVTDTLRLVLNVGDVQRLVPEMITNPSKHIKDRIIYRGQVFIPTRVLPRGSFGNRWAVVTIDCNQVNPEELVNDPQFSKYASPAIPDRRTSVSGLRSLVFHASEPLVPAFDPAITEYTLAVGADVTEVDYTPTAKAQLNATITDGTNIVESGATATISIVNTTTVVPITVQSANGEATTTYTVTITAG